MLDRCRNQDLRRAVLGIVGAELRGDVMQASRERGSPPLGCHYHGAAPCNWLGSRGAGPEISGDPTLGRPLARPRPTSLAGAGLRSSLRRLSDRGRERTTPSIYLIPMPNGDSDTNYSHNSSFLSIIEARAGGLFYRTTPSGYVLPAPGPRQLRLTITRC